MSGVVLQAATPARVDASGRVPATETEDGGRSAPPKSPSALGDPARDQPATRELRGAAQGLVKDGKNMTKTGSSAASASAFLKLGLSLRGSRPLPSCCGTQRPSHGISAPEEATKPLRRRDGTCELSDAPRGCLSVGFDPRRPSWPRASIGEQTAPPREGLAPPTWRNRSFSQIARLERGSH